MTHYKIKFKKFLEESQQLNWNDLSDSQFDFLYSMRYSKSFNKMLQYRQFNTLHELLSDCQTLKAMSSAISKNRFVLVYGETQGEILSQQHYKKSAITLKNQIKKYGETLGRKKFQEYCDRQSYTNTRDYKVDVLGWTETKWNAYNKSRAVTLENMIARYGEVKGRQKFQKYCDRQAYTNSEAYFGKERYLKVNSKKAITLENMIARYGETEGHKRFIEIRKRQKPYYSKMSQEFFIELCEKFPMGKVYYATNNREYGLLDPKSRKYYYYDFVSIDHKLCIEFHGDYYHGNPIKYKSTDVLFGGILVEDRWKADLEKQNAFINNRPGYNYLVVWESEYVTNKQSIFDGIENYVRV